MKYFVSAFLPFMGFFYIKKAIYGYLCLLLFLISILSLAIYPSALIFSILYVVMVMWSFFEINDYHSKQVSKRMVNYIEKKSLQKINSYDSNESKVNALSKPKSSSIFDDDDYKSKYYQDTGVNYNSSSYKSYTPSSTSGGSNYYKPSTLGKSYGGSSGYSSMNLKKSSLDSNNTDDDFSNNKNNAEQNSSNNSVKYLNKKSKEGGSSSGKNNSQNNMNKSQIINSMMIKKNPSYSGGQSAKSFGNATMQRQGSAQRPSMGGGMQRQGSAQRPSSNNRFR